MQYNHDMRYLLLLFKGGWLNRWADLVSQRCAVFIYMEISQNMRFAVMRWKKYVTVQYLLSFLLISVDLI